MPDPDPAQQLPEKDRLITRPDPEPLPAVQDPAVHAATPADPKPLRRESHGIKPRAEESLDYSV